VVVTELSPENKRYYDDNFCHFLFLKTSPELFSEEEFLPLDPTQELIFPPELMVRNSWYDVRRRLFKISWCRSQISSETLCRGERLKWLNSQLVRGWTVIICRVLSLDGTYVSHLPHPRDSGTIEKRGGKSVSWM
jgi:hypothetical protein